MFSKISVWAQRNMPTREQMEGSRFIPNHVLRSDLWRFNRRSVPRGVALGMLVGIIVPFAQILFAAALSLPVRANVPVAALTTFITNPFTTPLIWALSYEVGSWLLRADSLLHGNPVDRLFSVTDMWSFLEWLTAEGKVLAFGLVVVAVVSAAVSYLVTSFVWRGWIRHKRNAALERRREQQEAA
ncbi:MAG: DUF2062 domain-containing protein [Sphingomonadales bacterium]|nr:DUF2062 domain-containing protein [Sphingomonadales bacterium]